MKRRNPYPGLSLAVDRHGKRRWRFRQKGKPSGYIPTDLEYGSADFIAAYERLATGVSEIGAYLHRSDRGSLEWLTECTGAHRIGIAFRR